MMNTIYRLGTAVGATLALLAIANTTPNTVSADNPTTSTHGSSLMVTTRQIP
ncbi:hypothetical protein [Leptothermofonsia sp. ETS-13]|uniref:hypothetical protein n=1 Tax=Leptothermofonsia sp. ETS-13 TaxID=3035696 RepID=UPI003BA2F919